MMQGFEQAMGPRAQVATQQPKGMDPQQQPDAQLSPDQQAEVNKFVGMSTLMLYDEKFLPKAAAMIQKSPDIVDGMARLGSSIASRIYMAAKEQGDEIDPAVVLVGGAKLMGEITEFAQAAGADVGEEDFESAFFLAADMFQSSLQGAGALNPDDIEDLDEAREMIGEEQLQAVDQRMQGIRKRVTDALARKGVQS